MFKKILVPIDFSDESDRVLEYVKGLKAFGLEEIMLVHVVDVGRAIVWPIPITLTNAIETKIEERREALEKDGFKARFLLLEGSPSDEILKVVAGEKYSMIVTGSSGKRLLEEILLGSVSEKISRDAKIPVLLIRYDILKDIEKIKPLGEYAKETFRKVLFPSDFSSCSDEAFGVLQKLKKAGAKDVVALHVVDTKKLETEQEETERLEACRVDTGQMVNELTKKGFNVKSICKAGDPLREILLAAEENDASLILMGSHGKGVIREWLIGSVSLNVIRTANRPALVIHETA